MSHNVWLDKSLFVKTYKAGRRCEIDGKVLSIYNSGKRCKHHRIDEEEVMEQVMLCPLETRIEAWKVTDGI